MPIIKAKMTSGQKIAFSLLAALALFAVFVMSLHSRLFTELETRFYAQAKIEENTGQLNQISESCDSYISEILTLVEKGDNAWTKNASVRTYYVQNPSESDVTQRRRLTESLFSQITALSGIRVIDKNGKNVHYSSYDDTDLLKQSGISKSYKNYPDIIKDAGEIDFEVLQKNSSESKSVLLCDEKGGRLILSVPFCWVDGIYSGLALFYLNLREVEKELVSKDIIAPGEGLSLYADENLAGGFVLNIPRGAKTDFRQPLLKYWGSGSQEPEKLLATEDGRYYLALSSSRSGKIRISAVYTNDIFELSKEIRLLIYICIFISILLVVFLIFSFTRDPLVTLQKRIKKIQLSIIEDYLDGKEKREWADIARHLLQRRNDLSDEIIRSLHIHSKKRRQEISEYLEKNWDEIFAIFETKTGADNSGVSASVPVAGTAELNGASIAEIRRMLEEVLQNRNLVVPVAAGAAAGAAVAAAAKTAPAAEDAEELDEVEEIDEVEDLAEDAETVDELDEVEELAEDAEAVDDLDDAEEVEELAEEAEDAEEVEELAEEAEEVTEDAEEVEELAEEAEAADEVEELSEEVEEPAEELSDADEVEELEEEVGELDSADEAEEVDELDDADEVEELEEEVEDLDDEIETLEEYVEPPADPDEALIKSLVPPKQEYAPSNETFFATEKFANVENLFAEELRLGDFRSFCVEGSQPVNVQFYTIPEYDQPDQQGPVRSLINPDADIEDVQKVEEVPETEAVEEVQELEEPQEAEAVEEVQEVEEAEDLPEISDAEELTDEVPEYLDEPDFSMTNFADNLSINMPELEAAGAGTEEKVIVEEDGVFSISDQLEYTDVVQDQDFKELVDSVLQ